MHSQLLDHLEKFNLLTNYQYGYVRTDPPSLPQHYYWMTSKSVDCRELVGAVFVDLFKVFNTIGNEILLSKLPLYGIHNTIILNYHGLLITCSQGSN